MKKTFVLIGFLVLKFILQYVLISPEYDLHRDEYLYLDQGNHLAWGYLSVPPVTSWISWLIKLFGNGVFWVKFFPALFGVLTLLVVWKTIEELKGNLFALVLGATAITFSVLLRLNTLFQPNSLEVLCWTTFFYCIIKYISREEAKWLFIGAVICAIGFLNKYSIVFLMTGIVLAILLSEQRRLFFRRPAYVAALLALVIVLPNLLWQYQNDFPVIHHMRELSERQLVHVSLVSFFRSQVLYFIGAIFVLVTAFYALVFYVPFKPYRFLFWSFLLTMALFVFLKAKDYYTIGLYPIYLAFGSVYLSVLFERKGKYILQGVSVALPILLFIPLYQVAFPNRSPEYILQHHERYKKFGLLRWEDGKDHSLP